MTFDCCFEGCTKSNIYKNWSKNEKNWKVYSLKSVQMVFYECYKPLAWTLDSAQLHGIVSNLVDVDRHERFYTHTHTHIGVGFFVCCCLFTRTTSESNLARENILSYSIFNIKKRKKKIKIAYKESENSIFHRRDSKKFERF